MAYWDLKLLAEDSDFNSRVAACASTQDLDGENPVLWADQHRWDVAAAPGFADAYAYAILQNVPDPGRNAAVITDTMILAAVQAVLAE